jgi:hypothetical protein
MPHNLTLDEAAVLHHARLLMPPEYCLPHRWHLSNDGYVVPPFLKGAELRALMPPWQRKELMWAPRIHDWVEVFQLEREAEIARFVGPDSGRFNRID